MFISTCRCYFMLDRQLLNPTRCVSSHPPNSEALGWNHNMAFKWRGNALTSSTVAHKHSCSWWKHSRVSEDTLPTCLRTTASCSPPGIWEDSSLIPALSRLSHGVRPGVSGLFILSGWQNWMLMARPLLAPPALLGCLHGGKPFPSH